MKTFRSKTMTVAVAVAVIAALGISDVAFAGKPVTTEKTISLKQKKEAINNDVLRVQFQQKKAEVLDKKYKTEKSASLQNERLKAKADLKRDKSYLGADKAALLAEHKQIINQRTKAVWAQRTKVTSAKARLFAGLFKVKVSNIADAQTVVDASHALKQRNTALKAAKQNRNEDLIAINKDIRDVKGQNPLVLGAEDGAVKLQELALK